MERKEFSDQMSLLNGSLLQVCPLDFIYLHIDIYYQGNTQFKYDLK